MRRQSPEAVAQANHRVGVISITREGTPVGHVSIDQWIRSLLLKLTSVGRKCQPSAASWAVLAPRGSKMTANSRPMTQTLSRLALLVDRRRGRHRDRSPYIFDRRWRLGTGIGQRCRAGRDIAREFGTGSSVVQRIKAEAAGAPG
jgi:hypothetical protein